MNVTFKKLSSRAKPQTISLNKLVKHCSLVIYLRVWGAQFPVQNLHAQKELLPIKSKLFHILSFKTISNLLDRFLEVSNGTDENDQT